MKRLVKINIKDVDFENRECKYYPCHETDNINCLFCYCPLFPTAKIEHVIIPELKLCFFTETSSHFSLDTEEKTVHSTRFLNREGLSEIKQVLKFNEKTSSEMISEAVKKISIAKGVHDRLEDYYIRATDFSVIEEMTEKLMKEIF